MSLLRMRKCLVKYIHVEARAANAGFSPPDLGFLRPIWVSGFFFRKQSEIWVFQGPSVFPFFLGFSLKKKLKSGFLFCQLSYAVDRTLPKLSAERVKIT